MVNKWLNGDVMIDFKKAFDLVEHKILLQKLKHYSTAGNVVRGNQKLCKEGPYGTFRTCTTGLNEMATVK